MRVARSLEEAAAFEPVAVTIGNFDGVHTGHQLLLHEVTTAARRKRFATRRPNLRPAPRVNRRPPARRPLTHHASRTLLHPGPRRNRVRPSTPLHPRNGPLDPRTIRRTRTSKSPPRPRSDRRQQFPLRTRSSRRHQSLNATRPALRLRNPRNHPRKTSRPNRLVQRNPPRRRSRAKSP